MESKSDNHDNDENIPFFFLRKMKSEHPKNLFFAQLNVNSVRNKFESVQEITQNTFDIFLVCETKDRNAHGEGLLFYVNQDLNCKVLNKYPIHQDLRF